MLQKNTTRKPERFNPGTLHHPPDGGAVPIRRELPTPTRKRLGPVTGAGCLLLLAIAALALYLLLQQTDEGRERRIEAVLEPTRHLLREGLNVQRGRGADFELVSARIDERAQAGGFEDRNVTATVEGDIPEGMDFRVTAYLRTFHANGERAGETRVEGGFGLAVVTGRVIVDETVPPGTYDMMVHLRRKVAHRESFPLRIEVAGD